MAGWQALCSAGRGATDRGGQHGSVGRAVAKKPSEGFLHCDSRIMLGVRWVPRRSHAQHDQAGPHAAKPGLWQPGQGNGQGIAAKWRQRQQREQDEAS